MRMLPQGAFASRFEANLVLLEERILVQLSIAYSHPGLVTDTELKTKQAELREVRLKLSLLDWANLKEGPK